MTQIRTMTLNDYNSVYQLWISAKGMGLNSIDDSEEGISKYLKRNPDTCFIAEIKGKIIGAILAGHDGRRGYIHHTAVLESYRGQGIGKILLHHTLTQLNNKGIIKVGLVVFKNNKNGNAFWKQCRFDERTDLIYRDTIITEKELLRIDT